MVHIGQPFQHAAAPFPGFNGPHFLQEPQRKLPVHAVDAAEQRLIQPGSSKNCLAFTI